MIKKEKNKKYACSVKVGEKGQIVIPKEIRDEFGIVPGDTLLVLADKKRGIAIPPKEAFSEVVNNILGLEEDEENE